MSWAAKNWIILVVATVAAATVAAANVAAANVAAAAGDEDMSATHYLSSHCRILAIS